MEDDTFTGVFPQAAQTIRAASALAAQDVAFLKSVDAKLGHDIDSASKQVLSIVNRLFEAGGEQEDLIDYGTDRIEGEANWKRVSNALDNIFEKIDSAFDEQKQHGDSKQPTTTFTYLEGSTEDSNSDSKHTGKRLTKPQNDFRVKIDNSEIGPFKPKLTSKPHALKSYEETLTLRTCASPAAADDYEDPPFYPQPYETEIDKQPYPESIYAVTPPVPFKSWHDTSAVWVDSVDKLQEMIAELLQLTEIAVDLEHHDYRTYYGIVCLMQISNRDKDWIVDTLSLRDDLEPLNQVFTNPHIIKVFHGAFMDIIWLQRDLGLYVVSLFDTFHASKKLGFPKFSLAYLLEHFAKFKTSKKYQLADWRLRPLLGPMLAYARSDTHFLLNIFDQLRNQLLESGGEDKMKEVLYESRQVAKRRFEYTKFRPLINTKNVTCPVMAYNPREPYGSIISQYNVPLHKKPLVEALYNWRDDLARQEDESVRYILPNQLLVNLTSLTLPVDVSKIMNCGTFVTEHVRLHVKELAQLINTVSQNTEVNDWELVEKWNNSTDSLNDTAAFGNVNEEDMTRVFEDLKSNHFRLSDSLLRSESIIISSPFKMRYTVHYDDKTHEPVESHDLEERRGKVEEYFKSIEGESIVLEEGEAEHTEPEPTEQTEPKAVTEAETIKEDPNEIITLRKKKNNNINNKKEPVQAASLSNAFDYANADKILLDTKQRSKLNPKKRAFNPYGDKEDQGPQGAKRNKRNITGKTSTFSNKRR